MKIFVSNFLHRVGRYLRENRAKMIKALAIAAFALFVVGTIYNAVERWQKARYEKRVEAMETEVRAAETKAKEAEDRAAAMRAAIEVKYAEWRNLETRATAAETALRNTRQRIITLKETYEEIRNTPVPDSPVSCADACAELERLGYPCQ